MKKHKKLIIIIVIVAIVVGLGIWVSSCAKRASNLLSNMGNSAKTAEVELRDISNSISATGSVTSLSTRTLTTSLMGVKVDKVNVKLGDTVSKDDIICILDDSDLEEKLEDTQYTQNNTSKLTSIEKNSASRGLNSALETQQIEAQRADERVNKAQDTYNKNENKVNDAYKLYEEAHNLSAETFTTIQSKQGTADEINKKIASLNEELKNSAISFEQAKGSLIAYLTEISLSGEEVNIPAVEGLQIGQAADMTIKSVYLGHDEEIRESVKTFIRDLKDIEKKYNKNAEKVAELTVEVKTIYAELEQLNLAYQEYVKNEQTLKMSYESQAEALSSYKDALDQTKQARDDTNRSTQQNVDARKDALASTNINADSSRYNMENTIETIEEQISDCTVKSPIDGIITSINVIEGESYSGGALVTIEDTSSFEVTAFIDEYDISKVKVGQNVTIKTNGTGDVKLDGVIKTVSPRAERALTGGVEYKIIVSVLTPCEDLRLDMTAKLEIVLSEKKNVLVVPYDAIQVDEKGEFYVEVLDSGSPLDYSALMSGQVSQEDVKKYQNSNSSYESHKVYITKGIESDYYVEIISDELKDGTVIVIPSNDLFSDIGLYINESGAAGGF